MELETAVERLYTDESLAADVDDRTAAPLLKWAESVLPVLISRGDEEFDAAFVTLKKLIKSVARLIDMRGEIDMAERAERAEKIQGFAQQLGIIVNIDHLESLASIDGPEIVAQMVGPVAAFSAPSTPTAETAGAAPDEIQAQAASGSGTQIEPGATDRPMTEIAPDDKVQKWFVESKSAANGTDEPHESSIYVPASEGLTGSHIPAQPDGLPTQPAPQPPTAEHNAETEVTDEPVEPTEHAPPEESRPPAEKPSLLDGIGAFFHRVAERLDENKAIDQPDDKE